MLKTDWGCRHPRHEPCGPETSQCSVEIEGDCGVFINPIPKDILMTHYVPDECKKEKKEQAWKEKTAKMKAAEKKRFEEYGGKLLPTQKSHDEGEDRMAVSLFAQSKK